MRWRIPPQMREAYNECVPLLTAYSSELGQNAALQAGYAHVLKHEGAALDPSQRKVVENALRDFRLAGVDLRADQKDPLPRGRPAAGAPGHQVFRERARCRARLYAQRHQQRGAGRPARQRHRSRRGRCARGQSAGLAVQARSTHLHDHHVQRRKRAAAPRHLRGLDHARLGTRPERRTLRQQPHHCRDPAAAPRARQAGGFQEFRRLRAGHAHGEKQQAGAGLPG